MTHCGLCNNTGLVDVWHPKTIKACLCQDPNVPYSMAKAYDCVCSCKCSLGDKHEFWTNRDGSKKPWCPRYGRDWWHCRVTFRTRQEYPNECSYPYNPARDIQEQHITHPNHDQSLEAWNDGE